MLSYSIGMSALRSSQVALDTIANNIANANNPNYHRQNTILNSRQSYGYGGHFFGTGVSVSHIQQVRSFVVESSLTSSISDLAASAQRLDSLARIESQFSLGDNSLHSRLDSLFTNLQELSGIPGETSQRRIAIRECQQLAQEVRSVHRELHSLRSAVRNQVEGDVEKLNHDLKAFIDLEKRIRTESHTGAVPNDLLDQRDKLVNEIAEIIDVRRPRLQSEEYGISIGGHSLNLELTTFEMQTEVDERGNLQIKIEGQESSFQLSGGRLAGLLETHNSMIADFQERLDDFSTALIGEFNRLHSTGIGVSGSFEHIKGNRSFSSPDTLLAEAFNAFSPESGSLYISVIDESNGQRRLEKIDIDPKLQTVQDFADEISSLDNLQARVDSQTGTLKIFASPGYSFDFTGELETLPDLANYSGSSIPSVTGEYLGESNRQLTVQVVGTGTVGESEPLLARIIDEHGQILTEHNIGLGYEVGTELEVVDDVFIAFEAGDVVGSDSFTIDMVAEPDTAGVLGAFGLNSFFAGDDASEIRVEKRLLDDPDLLATSKSGEVGDTRNIDRLFGIHEKLLLDGSTLNQFLADTSADIGAQVQFAKTTDRQLSSVHSQLEVERAAISGVDPNEELIRLNQFQQSFEAAVRVLNAIDNTMDELFGLVR